MWEYYPTVLCHSVFSQHCRRVGKKEPETDSALVLHLAFRGAYCVCVSYTSMWLKGNEPGCEDEERGRCGGNGGSSSSEHLQLHTLNGGTKCAEERVTKATHEVVVVLLGRGTPNIKLTTSRQNVQQISHFNTAPFSR